jgi:uncharacterized protein (UPF0548 family)
MFSIRRPSPKQIEQFIEQSKHLALSYHPIGIAKENPSGFVADEAIAVIGSGSDAFERAKTALTNWKQFDLGWVELFPRGASIEPGSDVAVLAHHLGLWSLNGCRVVYSIDDEEARRLGFAYGTLTNHAECGEEIFEVSLNEREEVIYRIRAVSKPRAALTRIGYPITRTLQARFRRDSIRAMRKALGSSGRGLG